MPDIELENVRTNNLKSISVSLPIGQMTLVCGVSGSGKSSLVFDTLGAVGQQQFLETLSSSAQVLLATLPSPDADRVEFVPPTIALKQDEPNERETATVGTATDLLGLASTLFAVAGDWLCPECGQRLTTATTNDVVEFVGGRPSGERVLIGFPTDHLGESLADRLTLLIAARVTRVCINGTLHRISDIEIEGFEAVPTSVFGILDRMTVGKSDVSRIAETVELAFRSGDGAAAVLLQSDQSWSPRLFHQSLACPNGHVVEDRVSEQCLQHQSVSGVCQGCHGLGIVDKETCPSCRGTRIGEWSDRSELAGVRYRNFIQQPVDEWVLPDVSEALSVVVTAIRRRIDVLRQLGIGHLTIVRAIDSLSSGERLRVRLSGTVAADSVETLFVLDEPAASLHPADIQQVVDVVRDLRDSGNTVVIVDHSAAFLEDCERVIEVGPAAGAGGGEIVYDGAANNFRKSSTRTAEAFREPAPIDDGDEKLAPLTITLGPLSGERLPREPIEVSVGGMTVVTGRSGAGKTTLLRGLFRYAADIVEQPATSESDDIPESENSFPFDSVQLVEQRPPSRAARSCLVTQVKVFDDIRKLFASVPEAKARGWTAKHFSFNTAGGGRCRYCLGRGELDVPMGAFGTLDMTCPKCGGSRYESGVLAVKFRRRTIADVLRMTVEEAVPFFRTEPVIQKKLQPIRDVGLGYITLGQPASTLSGGENQRLHLAAHLTPNSRGPVLFLLDEPARGLHPDDEKTLAAVFRRLTDVGHTLVVAEHQLSLLSTADRVVDLSSGQIVFNGSPLQLLETSETETACELRKIFHSR